jgi:acid phosphatase (class A)
LHNWSAIEAGRINGASVYAALHGSKEFVADMAKAKAEIAAARAAKKPDAAACTKEFELTKPLPVQ